MDVDALNNQRWPYLFDVPSLNRGQASHLANPKAVPWLVGVDGRVRGGLTRYEGHATYGSVPLYRKTFYLNVTDHTVLDGSLTITVNNNTQTILHTDFAAGSSAAEAVENLCTLLETKLDTLKADGVLVHYFTGDLNPRSVSLVIFDNDGSATFQVAEAMTGLELLDDNLDAFTDTGEETVVFDWYPDGTQITFAKYLEILKESNTYLRGFLCRTSSYVFFVYSEGGDDAFDGVHFVSTNAEFRDLRMDATAYGRVMYVVGCDEDTKRAKVVYFDQDADELVTADMGVSPGDPRQDPDQGGRKIYWGDKINGVTARATLGGTSYKTLTKTKKPSTLGIAVDPGLRLLFYTDSQAAGAGSILVTSMDEPATPTTAVGSLTSPKYLTIDTENRKLWVTLVSGNAQVRRYDYDTSGDLSNPVSVDTGAGGETYTGIAYRPSDGQVYWGVNAASLGEIRAKAGDGSGSVTDVLSEASALDIQGLDVDDDGGFVWYLRDSAIHQVEAEASGSDTERFTGITDPVDLKLDVDNNVLYFSKESTTVGRIYRLPMDLSGSAVFSGYAVPMLQSQAGNPQGIALDLTAHHEGEAPAPSHLLEKIAAASGSPTDVLLLPGGYTLHFRYYDALRGRYSPISGGGDFSAVRFAPSDINTDDKYLRASILYDYVFDPAAKGYSHVELWTPTTSGIDEDDNPLPPGGLLYRRALIPLPDDKEWLFEIGTTSPGAISQRKTSADAVDALSDLALAQQTPYDPRNDYVTAELPSMEAIEFYQGSNFALCREEGFLDIRWTPLDRWEPENFQILARKRTKIPSGGVAQMIRAGDFLWVLGDGISYRIQKVGSALSIHEQLHGYKFVGPQCATSVGSSIVAVSTVGLVIIDANSGSIEHVSSADDIVLQRWASNLESTTDVAGQEFHKVFAAYDAQLGCVFIWNKAVNECLQLWMTTNRITLLVDCFCGFILDGYLPNTRSGGQRVFWLTPSAEGLTSTLPDYGGGFFLYPNPVKVSGTVGGITQGTANMLGLTVGSASTNEVPNLIQQPVAVSENADGHCTVRILVSSNAPNVMSLRAGRFAGATLYVLSGDAKNQGFKVYSSGSPVLDTGSYYVDLEVLTPDGGGSSPALATDLTTVDYVALAPVVTACMGWPLASALAPQDLLSRRVADSFAVLTGESDDELPALDLPVYEYGLSRFSETGEDVAITARDANAFEAALNDLPWTSNWTVDSGNISELDVTSPTSMFKELKGDGALLFPWFVCRVPGIHLRPLAMYVFGRIEPSSKLSSTL